MVESNAEGLPITKISFQEFRDSYGVHQTNQTISLLADIGSNPGVKAGLMIEVDGKFSLLQLTDEDASTEMVNDSKVDGS